MAVGSTNAQGISGMVFQGATSLAGGRRGLVPKPDKGDEEKVVLGNGGFDFPTTWGVVKKDSVGYYVEVEEETVTGGA